MSEVVCDLRGARILIVEDEPFIALDIAYGVEQVGGTPVGPASTVAQALRILEREQVDGAIVDVDLPDGTIGPVLERLRPDVPVVVHTGVGLPEPLRQAFPDVEVFGKPTAPEVLAARLVADPDG
ncbi:response regulator [Rhodobacteraceae bacterium 2CG4]|uniref:Response regulator n=1 Tax=Halovulum marinum TaxID=2662447 RepID=A0A6L5YXR2_9RHOB|nr:response regulator [Halovulum marinum]MSU89123.1 response regulator [Halovulum marinum]